MRLRPKLVLSAALWVSVLLSGLISGCASGPEVKSQAYAVLPGNRTFESPLPVVWKATLEAFRNYKLTEKDPDREYASLTPAELNALTEASLETDWIFTQSQDKYVEYKVNGSPRRKTLQERVKYKVSLKTQIGGTDVVVEPIEEVEKLKNDGKSNGYTAAEKPDSGRAASILDKINQSLLSAIP